MKRLSFYWALFAGLLAVLLQIAIFAARFGRMPTDTTFLDYVSFFIAGTVGGLILIYFLNRATTNSRWWLTLIVFLLATPVALFMMIGGGLIGPLGVIIFPQIPWLVAMGLVLLAGKLVSKM
jgi:hypothetical protein